MENHTDRFKKKHFQLKIWQSNGNIVTQKEINFTIYNFSNSEEIHLKLAHFNWIVAKMCIRVRFVHNVPTKL